MKDKIKSLIIEDDAETCTYLTDIIARHFSNIEILGIAGTVEGSISLIDKYLPELIFMDIELIDGTSFEVLEKIQSQDFEVIFITGHNDLVFKAIEHFAFSFILKPFEPNDVIQAVKRYTDLKERLYNKQKNEALSRFIQKNDALFMIQTGYEYKSIKIEEIVFCAAEGNYTNFRMTMGKNHLASKNLKYYEDLLLFKGFFKANRSTLVNIMHIKSIKRKETIQLSNGDDIAISVRNKSRVSDLLASLS